MLLWSIESESDRTLLAPAFPSFFFVRIGLMDRAGNKAGPLQHQKPRIASHWLFSKIA
jgi:hypothetical protein